MIRRFSAHDSDRYSVTMAASYRADADAGKHDTQLRQAVTKAMDFWFSRDFVPRDCLYNGGTPKSKCPCGTPGLWNTNWFSNVRQSLYIRWLTGG
jgi:hypothetical protein